MSIGEYRQALNEVVAELDGAEPVSLPTNLRHLSATELRAELRQLRQGVHILQATVEVCSAGTQATRTNVIAAEQRFAEIAMGSEPSSNDHVSAASGHLGTANAETADMGCMLTSMDDELKAAAGHLAAAQHCLTRYAEGEIALKQRHANMAGAIQAGKAEIVQYIAEIA